MCVYIYSGQSSWLQIQRSGFDSRRYQIIWEVAGLELSPLSYVSTIEELLERKSSGFALDSREYGSRDPSRWPRGTLHPQKLALTSPTSGCHSVGIVRSRTQATEFSFVLYMCMYIYIYESFQAFSSLQPLLRVTSCCTVYLMKLPAVPFCVHIPHASVVGDKFAQRMSRTARMRAINKQFAVLWRKAMRSTGSHW
jgi:hypothetical protein